MKCAKIKENVLYYSRLRHEFETIFHRVFAIQVAQVKLLFVSLIHFLIHSFSSLSYDRSKASSKASSPHSAI